MREKIARKTDLILMKVLIELNNDKISGNEASTLIWLSLTLNTCACLPDSDLILIGIRSILIDINFIL